MSEKLAQTKSPLKDIWPLFCQVLIMYVFLPESRSSIGNNKNPTFNENPLKHFQIFFLNNKKY